MPEAGFGEFGRYIFYHYWGGLGDILYLMFHDKCRYNILAEFEPQDRAVAVVTSPNFNARQLFESHPHGNQVSMTMNKWEAESGKPPDQLAKPWMQHIPPTKHAALVQDRLLFFPTPEDQEVLNEIGDRPYIVIAPTAAGRPRCFPDWLTKRIIQVVVAHGMLPVFVGASYKIHGYYPYRFKKSFHGEPGRDDPSVFSAINRLTVPGSIYAISKAAGAICCYSSMCVGTYTVRTPQLILTSDSVVTNLSAVRHRLPGVDQDPGCTLARFQDACMTKIIEQYVEAALERSTPQSRKAERSLPHAV